MLYILLKLLPTFSYIALGYVAKRWLSLSQSLIARLLFYVFVPALVFKGALLSDTGSFILLSALSFSVSLIVGFLVKGLARYFKDVLDLGVLRCLYAYFNLGWFGIPMMYLLFGDEGALIMTGMYVGNMLFGNTIGFLWLTSDQPSGQSALQKLLRIPALYAMLMGFVLHFSPFFSELSTYVALRNVLDFCTIVVSILGMGLVGMSVAHTSFKTIAWKKLLVLLGSRIGLSVIVSGTLGVLAWQLGGLSLLAMKVFVLMSLMPIASNILVIAIHTQQENEFVGLTLLFSTLLSCVLMMGCFAVL